MRPLHIRLITDAPESDDARGLVAMFTDAGHLVTFSDADMIPDHLSQAPDFLIGSPRVQQLPSTLEAAEAAHIARMLELSGGNRRRTAGSLGIARSTLLSKIRKYGL